MRCGCATRDTEEVTMNLKMLLIISMMLPALHAARAAEPDNTYTKLFNMQVAMAKAGKPADLYNLGRMYEQGMGTEQDLDKAHELYSKAASKGELRAKRKLRVWQEAEKEISDTLDISRPAAKPAPARRVAGNKPVAQKPSPEDRKRAAWKRAMAAALKRADESELGW